MHIAVGSDHRGTSIRQRIVEFVTQLGHEVVDFGSDDEGPVDYPDIAQQVAQQVGMGRAERGILVCGTGIGMSIAANKVHGVRAAPCQDDLAAEISRRHNDLNVLCLSADLLGEGLIQRMLEIWLTTPFEGGRHARRIDKITAIENEFCREREDES